MPRNDRTAVDAFVAAERFSQNGFADIVVTEVKVTTTTPGLEGLRAGQDP